MAGLSRSAENPVSAAPAQSQATVAHGAGHRHGLTQPVFALRLRMSTVADPRQVLSRVDQWLDQGLDIQVPTAGKPRLASALRAPEPAVRMAWRLLLIAGELLRALKLPSFEPGCLLGLEAERGKPGAWLIAASVPLIELMPRVVYDEAYAKAGQLLAWMQRTPCTPANVASIQQTLDQKFITPLKGRVPGGLSTIPILQAAHRRDVPFRHLGGGTYQLGWGCHARRVQRGAVDLDSAFGARVSQDKQSTAHWLRAAGLPAPVHQAVDSVDAALQAARQIGWPVVVKPIDRDRGEGVTINVCDEAGLRAAFETAVAFSRRLLVERQVPGVCHRLAVAGDRLLIVTQRLPKSVKGDGHRTVAELIRAANEEEQRKPPWKRLKPFPEDALALDCLQKAGLRLDDIPEEGRWAPLRPNQAVAWGGVTEDYTGTVHPANVELAVRAAQALGLSAAGVDVISTDIRVPWYENGAIVNEVNYSPQTAPSPAGLHMLDTFLDRYCPGDGRIPVEVVMGGATAMARARALQQASVTSGLACHLVSDDACIGPDGTPIVLAVDSVFERCRALLMRPDVGALVLVVRTDAWLLSGLPVDRFSRVLVLDEPLLQVSETGAGDEPARRRRLAGLLQEAGPGA